VKNAVTLAHGIVEILNDPQIGRIDPQTLNYADSIAEQAVVQCRKRGESLKTTAFFENMWNGKYLEDPDKQAELQAIPPTIFAYTQSDIFGKLRPHSQKC
jgi:hypothetical protein